MTTRERNKLGKQFVCEQLQREIHLDGDTLSIQISATISPAELSVKSANHKNYALLRVQYSRFHLQNFDCLSSGWHVVSRRVLENTEANFFVFVCERNPNVGEETAETCDYIIIKKSILLDRLNKRYSKEQQKFYLYLTTIQAGNKYFAVDARGIDRRLSKNQGQKKIPKGIQEVIDDEKSSQNYTEFLNNWESIKEFMEKKGGE